MESISSFIWRRLVATSSTLSFIMFFVLICDYWLSFLFTCWHIDRLALHSFPIIFPSVPKDLIECFRSSFQQLLDLDNPNLTNYIVQSSSPELAHNMPQSHADYIDSAPKPSIILQKLVIDLIFEFFSKVIIFFKLGD